MIRLRDATMLALTKLRTRKVRLTITIVVSGLLFGILAGASIVSRGAFASVESFSAEGLAKRFIVSAQPAAGVPDAFTNKTVIERAIALNKDLVKRKTAEAKRLGIAYDPAAEPAPVQEFDGPTGKIQSLTYNNPVARQAQSEYVATKAVPGLPELKKAAAGYGPTNFFQSRFFPFNPDSARLQVLKEGAESFDPQSLNFKSGPPTGVDSFLTSWNLMSADLLKLFVLPGQNLQAGTDGSIPVIVPLKAAEQLLQLEHLPASSSAKAQLARVKEIRAKAPQVTFGVCYRNSISGALVDQAVATQKEIEAHKGKKDYQKPELIYGLPTTACGAVPITRDVRSKEQKTLDAKQAQFDQTFGKPQPAQEIMKFRIVGLVPDAEQSSATNVTQIVRSLVTSSLGTGWYTPIEQAGSNTLIGQLFHADPASGGPDSYYAEFSAASQAKTFMDKQSCQPDYGVMAKGPENDPYAKCVAVGKQFTLSAYGSNSLGLESARKGFSKIFGFAALGVAIIACIIMMGTVGKMIADSRRETAVFRAIGAKKLDIAQIYILYTIFLSVLITVFAVLLGVLAASIAQGHWAEQLTVQSLIAYNAQDLNKTFNLYAFYWPDMLKLLGAAVVAGLVSAALPLLRNLRRNPMRDMRDDT